MACSCPGADSGLDFRELPGPTPDELERLTERIARHLMGFAERHVADYARTGALMEEKAVALR